MSGNQSNRESGEDGTWLSAFFRELVSMPKRHIVVFFITTVLLVLLEVEITEGWHLVHILEVLGGVLFLYLLWTAWWSRRKRG
ncbi:MAG: hypothetical protein ACE1ZK_02655 [Nitrospirales bacterium]